MLAVETREQKYPVFIVLLNTDEHAGSPTDTSPTRRVFKKGLQFVYITYGIYTCRVKARYQFLFFFTFFPPFCLSLFFNARP